MSEDRTLQIVRNFHENGLKQLLTSPANVRDLLTLARASMLPRLDFKAMQVDPTTYVTAEYRSVSSDLVLTLPLLPSRKGGRKRRLTLSILIELQKQPDRLMLLRVLEYLVQIWKAQVRAHEKKHKSLASVKLTPVLPVVLHTGSYSWEQMGTLIDLMDDAEVFRPLTPAFEPLFVSLPDETEELLENNGGLFGHVLALVKKEKASPAAFARRLDRTVTKVQELTSNERRRRMELLSWVDGAVNHWRDSTEHAILQQRINAALQDDEARLEMEMVRKTMAQVMGEQFMLEDRKRTLLEQLRLRFKKLPPAVEQTIQMTQDADQLAEWLRGVVTARDLDAIGIVVQE